MISEANFLDYTNSLLLGDKEKCVSIVEKLIFEKVDIKDIYVDLFQRSLYHIGKCGNKVNFQLPMSMLEPKSLNAWLINMRKIKLN